MRSKSGTNSAGPATVPSGFFQRARASAPATRRTQVYLGLQIKSELLPFQRRLQVRLQTDGARHLVFECFIKHSAGSAILLFCLLVRDIRTVNGRGKPLSAALQRTDATDDLRL